MTERGSLVADLSAFETSREWPPLGRHPRVLLVWPRFPPSFWGFEGMIELLPEKSVMPPLGLITVAALCPAEWELRLIDRAFADVSDEDLERADLVFVSAMHAQRADLRAVLQRAREAGCRTIIGGPYASSQPDALLPYADHVVVGEVETAFDSIRRSLESGFAPRLFRISDKPDLARAPIPRFDLLQLNDYASLSIQFSRGCPFQCEFCDIITIYGRRPRMKAPSQILAELEAIYELGWRKSIFIVDDNFIGNHKAALEMTREIARWQERHGRPFALYAEASIDLADRHELLDAMVDANFLYVFIGIETPSADALRETKKFQNLRRDSLEQIRSIQRRGLWVTGGFIVGFDSDDERIFDRQIEFIDRAAIVWAMAGLLQAPPGTALFERLEREGRLIHDSPSTSNFTAPNFETRLPPRVLIDGFRRMLLTLYQPDAFFRRAIQSLESWRTVPTQVPPRPPKNGKRVLLRGLWHQGVLSEYRVAYWRALARVVRRFGSEPAKFWLAMVVLFSAHHFIRFARQTAAQLSREMETKQEDSLAGRLETEPRGVPARDSA
jgi:radical SAM superfamily enzyme YgiQ (UPF0313 family)